MIKFIFLNKLFTKLFVINNLILNNNNNQLLINQIIGNMNMDGN